MRVATQARGLIVLCMALVRISLYEGRVGVGNFWQFCRCCIRAASQYISQKSHKHKLSFQNEPGKQKQYRAAGGGEVHSYPYGSGVGEWGAGCEGCGNQPLQVDFLQSKWPSVTRRIHTAALPRQPKLPNN